MGEAQAGALGRVREGVGPVCKVELQSSAEGWRGWGGRDLTLRAGQGLMGRSQGCLCTLLHTDEHLGVSGKLRVSISVSAKP